MNNPTIQSVKSNFDLANFTETELQEKIDQLTSLRKEDNSLLYLLLDLQDLLTVYRGVDKDEDAQQLQFSKIIDQLEEVNVSVGLKLFNFLFGYYENKIFLPGPIPLDNFVNVLTVIDKFPLNPRLPWPKVNGFLLFNEKKEEELVNPGTHNIKQDDFYGRVNVFNSEEDIVISNLQTPAYNSRKNDIYKLFVNLKIAKCINKTPSIDYLDLETQQILENDENWKIKNKNSEIDLDEYVTELFHKVYKDTKNEIQKQILVPNKIDIDSIKWDMLLKQAKTIKDQIIIIKNKYKNILDHFESDGQQKELLDRNKLLIEVREFLNVNKTKKENLPLKIDERFLPERNVIESITGGKGLMKRISLLEGGVIKFKRIYPQWIAQKIDKERAKALVNEDFKKYERRYSNAKYDEKNMTIENKPVNEI